MCFISPSFFSPSSIICLVIHFCLALFSTFGSILCRCCQYTNTLIITIFQLMNMYGTTVHTLVDSRMVLVPVFVICVKQLQLQLVYCFILVHLSQFQSQRSHNRNMSTTSIRSGIAFHLLDIISKPLVDCDIIHLIPHTIP